MNIYGEDATLRRSKGLNTMNILIVTSYFGGRRSGNPDVVDLAVRLHQRGHTVVALADSYPGDVPYEEFHGVRIFRVKPLHYFSGIDYGISFPLPDIIRIMKRFDIDVVHGIVEYAPSTISGVFLSSILRKPFVLTLQGAGITFGISYVDLIVNGFDHTLARVISSRTKTGILLSKNLVARARKIGLSQGKIRIIPTSIPYVEEFAPQSVDASIARKELGVDNKVVVCFVGRLVRLKGLSFLLQAQKALQKSVPNLHLLIVGYGPDKPLLESMAKSFDLKATFTGYVERNKIPSYLSAADIFVNPSLTEGLPLTVMEAMAMERAVVATDVGGTSDLIRNGENGFLIPSRDVGSLASAIRTLALDDKLRQRMGLAGRDTIMKDFSWSSITQKVEKVYEEALLSMH